MKAKRIKKAQAQPSVSKGIQKRASQGVLAALNAGYTGDDSSNTVRPIFLPNLKKQRCYSTINNLLLMLISE